MCIYDKGDQSWTQTAGQPMDNGMKSNVEKLCKWLDGQTELFIAIEFHAKMCSLKRSHCSLSKMVAKHVKSIIFLSFGMIKSRKFSGYALYFISQWRKLFEFFKRSVLQWKYHKYFCPIPIFMICYPTFNMLFYIKFSF